MQTALSTLLETRFCVNILEKSSEVESILLDDGTCQTIPNPAVKFSGFDNLPTYVLAAFEQNMRFPEYIVS